MKVLNFLSGFIAIIAVFTQVIVLHSYSKLDVEKYPQLDKVVSFLDDLKDTNEDLYNYLLITAYISIGLIGLRMFAALVKTYGKVFGKAFKIVLSLVMVTVSFTIFAILVAPMLKRISGDKVPPEVWEYAELGHGFIVKFSHTIADTMKEVVKKAWSFFD